MLYEAQKRPLPISYALLKTASELHDAHPDGDSEKLLQQAILEVFPSLEGNLEECVIELVSVMNKHAEEMESGKEEKPKPRKKANLLGQSTREWLFSMDADAVCVFVAGWDYDRAIQLYWYTDHRDVMRMFEIRAEYEETRIAIAYEGALYGFGGELKGGSGPGNGTKVHDMTTDENRADGWAALGAAFKRRN